MSFFFNLVIFLFIAIYFVLYLFLLIFFFNFVPHHLVSFSFISNSVLNLLIVVCLFYPFPNYFLISSLSVDLKLFLYQIYFNCYFFCFAVFPFHPLAFCWIGMLLRYLLGFAFYRVSLELKIRSQVLVVSTSWLWFLYIFFLNWFF